MRGGGGMGDGGLGVAEIGGNGKQAAVIDDLPVSYTHLRAHETPEHLVCRLLLEKKKRRTLAPSSC